jgi:hypothetical protein
VARCLPSATWPPGLRTSSPSVAVIAMHCRHTCISWIVGFRGLDRLHSPLDARRAVWSGTLECHRTPARRRGSRRATVANACNNRCCSDCIKAKRANHCTAPPCRSLGYVPRPTCLASFLSLHCLFTHGCMDYTRSSQPLIS